MPRKLIAELILDPSQYIRGLRKATVASNEFVATQRKTLGKAQADLVRGASRTGRFGVFGEAAAGSGALAGGLAAGALISGLKESVLAASDLNEQIAKTNTVFGQSAAQIEEWSKTTSTAFGISERDALKMASSFGALFAPVGLVGQKSADMSEKLTQLGGDLASFYNTDVQSALDAIQSGLVGQVRPLRAYGVQLSATRVQQQALIDTGKTSVKQLTDLDKTMARIKIIFEDTKKPQGDFARTQDHLAQQTKILKANIDDLSTSVGESLIPAVTDATGALNDLFGLMRKAPKGLGPGDFLGNILKQTAGPLFPALELYRQLFGDAKKAAAAGLPAGALGPIGVGGPAIGAPAGALGPDLGGGPKRATVEQRNAWFDALIGRQQLRAGLKTGMAAQIAAYQNVSDELTRQIAVVKDITRKNRLIDELLQNNATITGLQAEKAAKAAQDEADRKQRRKDAIAAAKQEHEDWLDFAYEKAQTTKTMRDNIKTAEAALAYWKHEAATGKYTVDEARRVLYWQGQLNDSLKKGGTNTDVLAGLMQVSSKQLANILAAGTGLSARGRAILGANIAGAEIQPLHVHVNIDGREVGRAVTADQARTGRRTAHQTSGRRG